MKILKHSLFNLPNIMTASNFICGIGSVICCFAGRIDFAILLVFLAMVFDFLDGFLARLLSISNNLGKQLDTLADVVSFGLAPGIIMMLMIVTYIQGKQTIFLTDLNAVSFIHYQVISWLNAVFHEIPNDFDASIKYLPFCALMIPFFSLFRLAKYNIDERQTDKFIGIPTPLNTLFFLFFPISFILNFENWGETFTSWYYFLFNPYFVSALCIVFPTLLLAEIPLMAMKFKHFRWEGNQFKYILLISSAISIPFFIVWSIPIIVLLYLSLSIVENLEPLKPNHEV